MSTRILLVDDHCGVRNFFRSLLEKNGFNVCGEASDGKEAIEAVRKLHPDIVLLDIHMPVMNGIQAAQEIRRIAPAMPIVFLTLDTEFRDEVQAISHGFVLKDTAHSELIPTLNRVLHSKVSYQWYQGFMDAFQETNPERLPAKIKLAEKAIDARLRTAPAPGIEEHCALSDALTALEDLASQQGQEEANEDIA